MTGGWKRVVAAGMTGILLFLDAGSVLASEAPVAEVQEADVFTAEMSVTDVSAADQSAEDVRGGDPLAGNVPAADVSGSEQPADVAIPEQSVEAAAAGRYIIDRVSPYDGEYLLVANVNPSESGEGESTGILPEAAVQPQNRITPAEKAPRYAEAGQPYSGYDDLGRGLIDPGQVLPELVPGSGKDEKDPGQSPEQNNYQSMAAYTVGQERSYTLGNATSNKVIAYNRVDCVCVAVGTYCTVWVPKDDPIYVQDQLAMQNYMADLATEFDARFPDMTTMFGSCSTADTVGDQDGKVALLCYDIAGDGASSAGSYVAGYFYGADLNYNFSNATGNNTDCLHIDSYQGMCRDTEAKTLGNVLFSKGTMVHELQHMIHFSQCRDREKQTGSSFYSIQTPTYLNEAYSMAAEHLCYGPENSRIFYYNYYPYIAQGRVSLFDWPGYDTLSSYSLSYLFSQYIRTQYQNDSTIYRDTMAELTPQKSLWSIICNKLGMSGEELLFNFRAALVLKDQEGVYGFHGEDWADSLSVVSCSAAQANTDALLPGAACVIPLSESFTPSGEGSHIRFAGLYPSVSEEDLEVTLEGGSISTVGGTLQLQASVKPAGADQTVLYSLPLEADQAIAEVTSTGLVRALADGTVTVRAASVFNPDKYAEATVVITGQNGVRLTRTQEEFLGGIRICYSPVKDQQAEIYYTTDGSVPTTDSTRMTEEGVSITTPGDTSLKLLIHDPAGQLPDTYQEEVITLNQAETPQILTREIYEEWNTYEVTLLSEEETRIFYSTDGSDPLLLEEKEYSAPFMPEHLGDTRIRAVAAGMGVAVSEEADTTLFVRYRIQDIRFEQESITLFGNLTEADRSLLLKPILVPAEADPAFLEWSSSNPAVVSVDESGNVRALAPGKATILAKADGISASVPVQVAVAAEEIRVENPSLKISKNGGELQLKAQVYPSNAVNRKLSYTAEPSDRPEDEAGLACVSEEGVVQAVKDGVVKITISAEAVESRPETAIKKIIYIEISGQTQYQTNYAPRFSRTVFSLNKQQTQGQQVLILPQTGSELSNVQIDPDSSYAEDFICTRVEETDLYEITLTEAGRALKTKTKAKLPLLMTMESGEVFSQELTLTITDVTPKVKVPKLTCNGAYPNRTYVCQPVSAQGNVTVSGLEDLGSQSGFTENFAWDPLTSSISLKRSYEQLYRDAKGKPVTKGFLRLQVEGYREQLVPVTIPVTYKLPAVSPATAVYSLNYALINQEKSFVVTLESTFGGKKKQTLSGITGAELDTSSKAYKKIQGFFAVEPAEEGNGVRIRSLQETLAAGNYTIPLLIDAADPAYPENAFAGAKCSLRISVKKQAEQPAVTLTGTKLTLNKRLPGEKAVIGVRAVSQSNAVLTDMKIQLVGDGKKPPVDQAVSLVYDPLDKTLTAYCTEETPGASQYVFTCTPVFSGEAAGEAIEGKTVAVKVSLIDKAYKVSLKASGSVDVLNRTTSRVTYRIAKSGFTDEIQSVELMEPAKLTDKLRNGVDYLEISGWDAKQGTIQVRAKENVSFEKKCQYAFRFVIHLKNSGQLILTPDVKLTPRQAAVRLSVPQTTELYTRVAKHHNIQTLAVKADKAQIDRIEFRPEANKKLPAALTVTTGENGLVQLTFDGSKGLKKGSYTLVLDVYYTGQLKETGAVIEKPVTCKVKIKVR